MNKGMYKNSYLEGDFLSGCVETNFLLVVRNCRLAIVYGSRSRQYIVPLVVSSVVVAVALSTYY